MKKYALLILLFSTCSTTFADLVDPRPTGSPMLNSALVIGIVAVAVLLLVRQLRRQRNS
ncbi:hypothetical protein IC229_24190 [Spirosoma sp. BT702]|uniref:LPXTG cell wall anchor domain-containing protein n=1 Tax=Spirosoma profusum TaxID=2771354 RepID=A0A927ASF2_9BACT|nr:hypothetical protein [Spirosoma profusum]MBD2703768.1 hypothetical protein [Spirosoma profusum]